MSDIITGVDINEKAVADLDAASEYKLLGSVDGAVKRINAAQLPFIALPTEGSDGQVLTTDGAGTAAWKDPSVSNEQFENAITAYEAANPYSPAAPVETSLTASQAYAIGDFFVYQRKLYKVTAAIASGEAIVIGTNCAQTYAGTEINTKQDALTFDATPTASSTNPVTSGGVKTALDDKSDLSNIAYIEAEAIATQDYAIGDFLVLDGQLYKATAAITSGAALIESTNIEATTAGAELASRKTANNLTTTEAGYVLDARQGKALSDSIDTLNSELAIKSGDTFTLKYYGSGYLTNDSSEIDITIPLNKPVIATSVYLSNAKLTTRQNSNYTHGSAYGTYVSWSVSEVAITEAGINVILLKSDNKANAINNAPIGIAMNATFTFT